MKEITFKIDFENFYCPVTGQQVLDPQQYDPSPATVFTYLHTYEYFEHLQEDLKQKFSEEFDDETKHVDLYLKLTEEVLKDKTNYLWVTYGGPPFGAVSLCFDMAFLNADR